MTRFLCIIAFSFFTLSSNAADTKADSAKADPDSIFHRIGGQAAIDATVDLFYSKVLADDRVKHFFEDVNMKRQHNRQKSFIAAALGSPIPYEGKNMRAAHQQLDLTEEHFGAIAEHLQASLKELGVEKKVIAEVLAVVATTKDDVLNRKKAEQPATGQN
ncbi:MAG: hemoglobin [Verrucomicrobiales bacterium]|jgi:hemoglobin